MKPLLETIGLKKYFSAGGGLLHAVDGVNLKINAGETLGVVGESGCGKSTLGRVILRLTEATAGQVLFDGQDIGALSGKELRHARRDMQIIMQDPYSSVNPRMTVYDIIADPLKVNHIYRSRQELNHRVGELMDMVGLSSRVTYAYPHELDGGRRQRMGIARAIALNPRFIVCDEPVSALDVSIQAQTLNLLMDLQRDLKLAYLFITHDLSVVKHISNQVAVMYLGKVVETADSDTLFSAPAHPYTQALLRSIPLPDPDYYLEHDLEVLGGEVSSPIDPAPGCRFAPRCPHACAACTAEEIALRPVGEGHEVACILTK